MSFVAVSSEMTLYYYSSPNVNGYKEIRSIQKKLQYVLMVSIVMVCEGETVPQHPLSQRREKSVT